VATTVYNVQEVTMPIAKIGFAKTKAQIIEVLKVYFNIGSEDYANGADRIMWAFLSTNTNRTNLGTSAVGTSVQDFDDPRTFAFAKVENTFTTSGMSQTNIQTVDLTDSNGNGVLIGVDRIAFVYSGVGQATSISASCKVLYRYVNVGIQEYVGIVQGQQ